jgi:GTP-binding protein
LKEQTARLKRAAKKAPLVISAATGQGIQDALRALIGFVDTAREKRPVEAVWHP